MNDYILRLVECGFTEGEAYALYDEFLYEYTMDDLRLFVEGMECG